MTTKDERDIFAYWCADCSISWSEDDVVWDHDRAVDSMLAEIICAIELIKLHLRPISSLTDEELKTCYLIVYPEFKSVESIPIYRELGDFSVGVLQISQYREYLFADTTFGIEPIDNPGAVIAYLQSIAVYVPGCINSDYVQLIEP